MLLPPNAVIWPLPEMAPACTRIPPPAPPLSPSPPLARTWPSSMNFAALTAYIAPAVDAVTPQRRNLATSRNGAGLHQDPATGAAAVPVAPIGKNLAI